jgi:ATP-dependent helicase/nuclease subunit B
MPAARTFLGWNRPALEQAAQWLLARYASAEMADLTSVVVALPGARAGRRLLELLVEQAEARHLALTPPRIVTVGHLPEKLYEPESRPADRLTCQLAWLKALAETDAELLRRIVPEPPDRKEAAKWLGLVELVQRLHTELAGHGWTFTEIAEHRVLLEEPVEAGRWQTLAAVQADYVSRLKKLGLADTQLARLDAVKKKACRSKHDLVLVGLADLTPVVEQMLEQVADRVTALIGAPAELAERFTRLGALVIAAWRQAHVELKDEQILVVEGPADQATAAVEILAGYQGRYAADEITIGVPDASVVPFLERRFEQFDIPSRYAEALRLKQTAPYRLLAAVADYVDGERFAEFAALLRHPDLEIWLAHDSASDDKQAGDWLAAVDAWYTRHLQSQLDGGELDRGAVAAVRKKIDRLGKPFRVQRPLAEWAQEIATLLVTVYGQRELDRNHTRGRLVLEACEAIHTVLLEAFAADSRLAGRWQGADAIRLLLRQIEDEPVPPVAGHSAVEFLGWLELPLDDAPALIVTGFNDGLVPSFINADPFLPNALRRELGLLDNDRRYARDAYALTVLAGSRRELRLIAGRRSAEGDPLSPSRLALACPRGQIAGRVLAYFGVEAAPAPEARVPRGLPAGRRTSTFEPPRPEPQEKPITSMRVTQFRDYLACPYRYYLRHVLRLAAMNDLAEELDPLAFGSLAHDVLKAFGEVAEHSRLTDADKICAVLDAELDRLVVGCYGKRRLPAVSVQIEQLRLRLASFARWQAGWAAQDWRIVKTEVDIEDGTAPFPVDGQPMYLRGRIDRIDRNERDGRYLIFDYKTSEAGDPPDKTHRKNGKWVDLQLPLYRHLARVVEIDTDQLSLGYIVLPKDLTAVREHLASWTADDFQSADAAAEQVIRDIRVPIYGPPASPGPAFDDFAAICLDKPFACPDDDGVEEE